MLAAPNGLVLDFEVSQGKENLVSRPLQSDQTKDVGLGEAVVLRLCQTLNAGTDVYFDRYFTTIKLLDKLSERVQHGTGTIQRNRIPKACLQKLDSNNIQKKLRGSSVTVSRSGNSASPLAISAWFDNKVVYLASNHEGIQPEVECNRWSKKDKRYLQIKQPSVVRNYNKNMGGIDLIDQIISYYRMGSRTKKWTVRTIMHFIDLAAANSWREYMMDCESEGRLMKNTRKYLEFKLDIAESLLSHEYNDSSSEEEGDSSKLPRSQVLALPHPSKRKKGATHLPHLIPTSEPYHRCRLPGCSKLSRTYYESCRVFLCFNSSRNCFSQFHK